VNSPTTRSFRDALKKLSPELRRQARKAFKQFQEDPFSPGLSFEEVNTSKRIGSARITRGVRALGIRDGGAITWYWVGIHREYEKRKK
jgi:hypothetical protein